MWFKSGKEFTNFPLKTPKTKRITPTEIAVAVVVNCVFGIYFWNDFLKDLKSKDSSGKLGGNFS